MWRSILFHVLSSSSSFSSSFVEMKAKRMKDEEEKKACDFSDQPFTARQQTRFILPKHHRRTLSLLHRLNKFDQLVAIRGKRARRICPRRVARNQGCLAAATPKIDFPEFATPAGLRHPRCPSKAIERFRFAPNPAQVMLTHILEPQSFDFTSRGARQHFSDRINCDMTAAPAMHAGFGTVAVVIRHDE